MATSSTSGDARPVISIDRPILSPQQEQEKWLAEAIQSVHQHATAMKVSIKENAFTLVIRSASVMLYELRTTLLAPHNYYELYVKVFDEMQHFVAYISDEHTLRKREMEEIYERVQYTGFIVPRLYLLIAVGAVYIDTGEQPALEIAQDLVEMCKGVQHPTHGLFLRSFWLTMMKNKLPGDINRTVTTTAEEDGGTAANTADLLVQNFQEMNWLWIRMEAKGYGKEIRTPASTAQTARRTLRDRRELRVLVGMNVVRISQLEGIDLAEYQERILPKLLSIILRFREPLAQQYLFEVIVQVFPDDYHLFTLEAVLAGLGSLSTSVDVCAIIHSLMVRLGNYVTALREGVTQVSSSKEEEAIANLFHTFLDQLERMPVTFDLKPPVDRHIKRSQSIPPPTPLPLSTYVGAMVSLAQFTVKTETRDCEEHLSEVLQCVSEKIAQAGEAITEEAAKAAEKLLVYVVGNIKDVGILLDMDGLHALVGRMPFKTRRMVAMTLCDSALAATSTTASSSLAQSASRAGDAAAEPSASAGPAASAAPVAPAPVGITTLDRVARLFDLLDPIVSDQSDAPADKALIYQYDPVMEFQDEQQNVCRVLHLIHSDDPAVYVKMLSGVRRLLGQGGPTRIPSTFPTLAWLYMRGALQLNAAKTLNDGDGADVEAEETKTKDCQKALLKVFHHLHSGDGKGILEVLASDAPMQTFFTYLACANCADTCELPDVCYDLYAEAFALYEANAADTRDQLDMLVCLINSLYALLSLPEESYEVIATKVCQYCSKLVRKQDQSRMVALCANLFSKKILSSESQQRVSECLNRAVKIAGQVVPLQQLGLYVDLLNLFLHFYAAKNAAVTVASINNILDTIRDVTDAYDEQRKNDAAEAAPTASASPSPPSASTEGSDEGGAGGGSSGAKGTKEAAKAEHTAAVSTSKEAKCTSSASSVTYEASRLVYRNTTKYIRSRQAVDERWEEIES